jgi:uncharacterized protein YdeI (YjbR/CyaY-like superfamily)
LLTWSLDAMSDLPADAVHPKTRAAWRTWLIRHHASSAGIWLVSYKKATGLARFDYDAAVEEALCVGWVDSKPRKLDDARSMLWFAPRKPGTGWSKPNKERIARLIAAGAMLPTGLAKVDAAQRDGSWIKLDAVEALEVLPDLAAALKRHPPAAVYFEAFPRSVKRGILEWIVQAKRAETRAKRIDETAILAARNERANQWRK